MLGLKRNISSFTAAGLSDPSIAFLMMTDEERASAPVPVADLDRMAVHFGAIGCSSRPIEAEECGHTDYQHTEDNKILNRAN